MNLFPQGFHAWSNWIAVPAVIGIVYAAAVALRQSDLKFVIGYSSVSHMGFVLLGLATANALGVSGAVLQMFSSSRLCSSPWPGACSIAAPTRVSSIRSLE